jgi:hypothetical protein
MSDETLEKFLEKKKTSADKQLKSVNWEERKRKWLNSLDELYAQIADEWLSEVRKKKILKATQHSETITEEYLGSYRVKKLQLVVGNEKVTFSPKGTTIVGGVGRVDMVGEDGTVMLVMAEWGKWSIAVRTPKIKYWPLTKESFSDALRQVMRK